MLIMEYHDDIALLIPIIIYDHLPRVNLLLLFLSFDQRWWPLELNLRISKSIRIDLLVAYTAGCCKHCASICDVTPRTLHCLSDEAMQRMDLSMQTCEGAKKMPFGSFHSGKCSNIHCIHLRALDRSCAAQAGQEYGEHILLIGTLAREAKE